ncbi:response regulator [Paenibacillus sp. NPDC058174]|uniref:response regulator n=1 Tax=Paenibacillus sp. NPDC058174 TaxID=3346366 RepID=UPI0036DBE09C
MNWNMLVVDDEIYAVKGITQGIDWSDTPIQNIYEATDAEEAKRLIRSKSIDVLISDIEMPDEDGIRLLEWVQQHSPSTETIFISAHAKFSYAQQAIHHSCFGYLLKPVDYSVLKEMVLRAFEKVSQENEHAQFHEIYQINYNNWRNQLPILVECFWIDVLAGRWPTDAERLTRGYELYDIPLNEKGKVLPVLISIEQWKEDLSTRDEEIMEYAIRNAASEIILGSFKGAVIQERSGVNLVLVYESDDQPLQYEALLRKCEDYIVENDRYFHCKLSCYVGLSVPVYQLSESVRNLLRYETKNTIRINQVIDTRSFAAETVHTEHPALQPEAPLDEWAMLLESGKTEELFSRLDQYMKSMQHSGTHPEWIESLYYGIIGMLYQVARRKSVSVQDILAGQAIAGQEMTIRTAAQLRPWAFKVLDAGANFFSVRHDSVHEVVARVRTYIKEHLHEELTREEIASSVFLNPAYLSRLYKKETGVSLTDYILKLRMDKAKLLLSQTNELVSTVADAVGYTHFSHFAKMFKKITGVSPQEYRKTFQD